MNVEILALPRCKGHGGEGKSFERHHVAITVFVTRVSGPEYMHHNMAVQIMPLRERLKVLGRSRDGATHKL